VGKIRDLDGNMLLAFADTVEWKCVQGNIVKSRVSDPTRKLVEVVCDKIADEVAAYFTTKLSFKVKVPKGMDKDAVEIYVDGREVDSGGTHVLAFEHVVKASLDGCTTVRKIVEIENGKSEKKVKLNLKAKRSAASTDSANAETGTVAFGDLKNNKKLEDSAFPPGVKCSISNRHSHAQSSGHKVQKKVEFALKSVLASKQLQKCDFLLNKNFKKTAKVYLCLFSASWCPPCRREMPRIAQIYAEKLKSDPDIELIHFSRDKDEDKALAWAKEHDIKFPVVKYNGGNPLNLQTRGIPHLFIVKADGTVAESGHPMKLFTEEKLRDMKSSNFEGDKLGVSPKKTDCDHPGSEGTLQGSYGT
jgi:thiol-disulfide isomerase/thioredoxin